MEFLMSIAGFDPTGGAGILRDYSTFRQLGFLGCGAITANTAQNTKGVKEVMFVKGEFLLTQLDLVLEELPVKGVKVGLPHSDTSVNLEISRRLRNLKLPVVFDPVLKPTYGVNFVKELSSIEPLIEVATVLTPNYEEFKEIEPLLKGKTFVLKGCPSGKGTVEDLLIKNGEVIGRVSHKKDSKVVRGTGCTFSSALLSFLVKGFTLVEAFKRSVEFVRAYRENAFKLKGWKQLYSKL